MIYRRNALLLCRKLTKGPREKSACFVFGKNIVALLLRIRRCGLVNENRKIILFYLMPLFLSSGFSITFKMDKKHELSPTEKYLVVKTHNYFKRNTGNAGLKMKERVRDHVKDCLGFSLSTISKIMANWETYGDPKFEEVIIVTHFLADTSGHIWYEICCGTFYNMTDDSFANWHACTRPRTVPNDSTNCEQTEHVHKTNNCATSLQWSWRIDWCHYQCPQNEAHPTKDGYAPHSWPRPLHFSGERGQCGVSCRVLDKKLANWNAKDHPRLPEIFLDESTVTAIISRQNHGWT